MRHHAMIMESFGLTRAFAQRPSSLAQPAISGVGAQHSHKWRPRDLPVLPPMQPPVASAFLDTGEDNHPCSRDAEIGVRLSC